MRQSIFKPGEGCGPFCVLSLLGSGGTADVYRAVHTVTHQVIALKCIRLSDVSDTYVVDHMLAEAELLSRGAHENVVRVEDVGIDNGVLWMAMELLSGMTLRRLVRQSGALPLPTALYYAREIAEGVASIHAMRVIHRDIKPENVVITEQNRVKVLDTGAAKFFGRKMRQTRPGLIFGTMLYISPEHLQGETIDARSDIYALGLTLYEMIAGRHPFREPGSSPSEFEIIQRQLLVDPAPLAQVVEGVPSYVSDLVARAISKNRDRRPASMSEFAQELRAMLISHAMETQAIFAVPEITLDCTPSTRAGSAAADAFADTAKQLGGADGIGAPGKSDEAVTTLNLRPGARRQGERAKVAEAPTLPDIEAAARLIVGPEAADDPLETSPTVPIQLDSVAADTRDSLALLQSGWIPASVRMHVVEPQRPRRVKRYAPVALGSLLIAALTTAFFTQSSLTEPRAAAVGAASLEVAAATVLRAGASDPAERAEEPVVGPAAGADAHASAPPDAAAVRGSDLTASKETGSGRPAAVAPPRSVAPSRWVAPRRQPDNALIKAPRKLRFYSPKEI